MIKQTYKLKATFFIAGIILTATMAKHHLALDILDATTSSIHHFASGFSEKFNQFSGIYDKVNLVDDDAPLAILSVGFKPLGQDMDELGTTKSTINDDSDVPPEVTTQALFYPNPVKQSEGAELGYGLSKDMDIEIQIYDMLANRIFRESYSAGSQGGRKGYNRLTFDLSTFNGDFLSAGVYFYLLLHEGDVLSKGKMAIVP